MNTEQLKERSRSEEPSPGIIDTIIGLGTATTNLAIDQVGNAFTAIVHPVTAIQHVKDTLQNLSTAMNNSAKGNKSELPSELHSELPGTDLRGAPTGMEHLTHRSPSPPVEVVRETPFAGNHAGKINHRKT